jgi:hypothetical protein
MKNDNNPLMESFINDLLDILLDEEKSDLFSENDIVGVKTVMAESYYDKAEVLNKIANSEQFRQKFGSSKLVSNLINDLDKAYDIDLDFNFLNQKLESINLFEEKFFSNITYGTALKFILELIKNLITKYAQTKPIGEEEQLLFSNLYSLYKRTIEEITINDSNKVNFQQLYNQLKAAFVRANYKDADIYFEYLYLYTLNLKELIAPHDVNNNIVNYLNSNNNAESIRKTLIKVVEIKKLFENTAFRDTIFNRAKTQQEFTITFYFDFSDIKKQELIEQWVPLNANRDYNIFESILENIEYQIPEPDKLGVKILNTTGRSNLLHEREKLFDLLFRLELTNDFDYSTYSQQIITNICSTNIEYHKLGIAQLSKHRNRVVEFNLKTGCEQALLNNFLPNVTQYHLQITNLLSIDIGMKRVLNDAIKDNPNFINSIVNYLMTANSSSFFKILKPNLFKNNYLLISKQFLNNSANQLRNNKTLINNYKGILNMQLSKYFKDSELEFKNLVNSYNLNLNQEKDETIINIEEMLNN